MRSIDKNDNSRTYISCSCSCSVETAHTGQGDYALPQQLSPTRIHLLCTRQQMCKDVCTLQYRQQLHTSWLCMHLTKTFCALTGSQLRSFKTCDRVMCPVAWFGGEEQATCTKMEHAMAVMLIP